MLTTQTIQAKWPGPGPDDEPAPPGKPSPKPIEEPPLKPGRDRPDPKPIDPRCRQVWQARGAFRR
jgi:hypothetical protein